MRHPKRIALALGGLVVLVAAAVGATNLNWIDKTTVVVDATFQVSKPSASWDTQTKDITGEAVRWVLHRTGANPIIKLIYDPNARGKTAHDYGNIVKRDLELRNLVVTKKENRVINGRNVSLISARDPEVEGKLNYLVAVYRDREKGLKLECSAGKDDFAYFTNEFMAAINSVRFVRQ